jgi:hypothetical protein
LALLALTAMHALPMASAHSDAAAPAAASAAMHGGHVDGMVMGAVATVGAVTAIAPGAVRATATAAAHNTDGVLPHGHSLLHLCVAVLVVGLSLALAAVQRRRPWASAALTRMAPVRAVLSRETGPPSLAGLCLLRC